MGYTIIGSIGYTMDEEQIDRLCSKLGVKHISTLIDQDNDRYPLHFIDVKSIVSTNRTDLTKQVKEIFGSNFEVKLR